MVMERIVYYNGDFLPTDKVAISPFNRGLLYGDGVFETLRAYSGRVFRLEQHLIRMHEGLQVLRIEPNREAHGIERAINELIKHNNLSDAALRISVFRGDGEGPEPAGWSSVVYFNIRKTIQYVSRRRLCNRIPGLPCFHEKKQLFPAVAH